MMLDVLIPATRIISKSAIKVISSPEPLFYLFCWKKKGHMDALLV